MFDPVRRSIDIRVVGRSFEPRDLAEIPCHCGSPLSLLQPDPERPGLLLGICPDCGDLSYIDSSGEATTEVYRLPCPEELARAAPSASTPAAAGRPRPGRRR